MANINRYKPIIAQMCSEGHWTAEQVQKEIRHKYPWSLIGLGTIYRNLTELVNEGVLMKQHGLADKIIYESKKSHHGHIFCQNSGSIVDLDISKVDFKNISIPNEFCNLDLQLTFAGYFNGTDPRFCAVSGKKLVK